MHFECTKYKIYMALYKNYIYDAFLTYVHLYHMFKYKYVFLLLKHLDSPTEDEIAPI